MLSRTADHLFWMARYMERAENTARMLDVNYEASLLPQTADAAEKGWKGLLSISELTGDYAKHYGAVTPDNVMRYMVSDAENGSSIRNCLLAARENARAVRGTLTTEVWETQNQTWLEFQRMVASDSFLRDPSSMFEWVKFRSHLSRSRKLPMRRKWKASSCSIVPTVTPRDRCERNLTHSNIELGSRRNDSLATMRWNSSQVWFCVSQTSVVSVPRTARAFSRAASRQLRMLEPFSASLTM